MISRSRTARRTAIHAAAQAGFTLIEMIIVIVVLGLGLAVTASFLPRRHAGLDLANASDGLAEALRSARARAIASQNPVLFAPSKDGHGYFVDGSAHVLPADIVLSPGPAIRFAPDGSSSGGILRMATAAGPDAVRLRVIRVDWLTGQVGVADAR
jgi:general secretion pathway protein H